MNPTLLAILTFLKPYAWYLALGLVSLVLSHKSQIDDWAEKNPRYAAALKFVRALGLDPWLLLQSLTLLIKGRLPDNVAAGSKSSTRVPPGLSLMILAWFAFGAVVTLTSCSAAEQGWNALTPAQREQLVQTALTDAGRLCSRYEGSGGQKNAEIEQTCFALKVGTIVIPPEPPAPSASSSPMPAGSAQ